MTTPHSDIPQCNNSNEPEEMNQSEEKMQPAHCHMQMSSPLCTDCVAIQYPSDITTESARKNYKQKLLKDNPEILFADSFKTGEFCNLIFFTDHPNVWHKAIINHYPSVKKEGICNGWKVKIREPCDPDNTMITVNIYKNGTVMVQGHLKTFQTDYSAIMKLEKALLSERLSSEQNTQSSNTDLKPIPAESPAQDPSSPLLKSIPVLQEHFTRLEMEMVQLRETVLKQEHHTEQLNSEHITQRLSALTQQVKSLQTEKDSYQKELATLRLQLQDREHLTLEMRQQLRELQEEREQQHNEIQALKEQLREIQEEREEREQQHSEIQALKEQLRELLLTRQEPEQTHRAQILPSTPETPTTVSQHPERPDPDSSQSSQRLVSSAPEQHQQHPSDSSSAPTSTEGAEIALLIDSNGKFIDIKKLFPRHRAVKHWCPNTDKALELLTESQLGHPSHIIIHTGTNDLRSQQDRVSDSLRAVVEKARHTFPNSKIILSTLLQRKDFHPNTINKINSNISRHCALVPNVYLAHHPDLDTDCLYDHVHLYKNLVHILAKRFKDVTLNRTNQTSPRWSRTSPDPTKPARHASRNSIPPSTSSRAPSRASAPREEPHRQRLLYKSPTAPPSLTPPEPERQSYAQAVSGGVNPASAELHNIQHMLSIICSHLLTHSGQR